VAEDGSLDREAMRDRVFADPSAKARLQAILHPLIGLEAQSQARAAGTAPVVFDVPLLAESSHWRQRVRRVWVVDCLESTQVRRVMQRSGWTEDQVRRVIEQQARRTTRRAIADAVIFNDTLTRDALGDEVRALWRWWLERG
ncbi:MAG: dephospho-CoA kinase, partial [Rubrivivax sp.]